MSWRLPNQEELTLMYTDLCKQGKGNFGNFNYWSSTQIEEGGVWDGIAVYFGDGYVGPHGKANAYYIRTMMDFQSDQDYNIGDLIEFGMIFYKDGNNYKSCRLTNEDRLYTWDDAVNRFK